MFFAYCFARVFMWFLFIFSFVVFNMTLSLSFNSSVVSVNISSALIKKKRHNNLILWSKNEKLKKKNFNWLKKTNHERQNDVMLKASKNERRRMLWNNKYKKNQHWNYFIEITRIFINKFRLFCRRYSLNIIYSNLINNENNSIINYWISDECKRRTANISINKNIIIMFRNVSDVFIFITNFYNEHVLQMFATIIFFVRAFVFFIDNFTKQLINILIVLNVFFREIKHSKFVIFICMLKSNVKIFKRTKLKKLIQHKIYAIRRSNLCNLNKNIKLNIVFDNWTSLNKIDFMKIIDYFINMNWNYKKILLIFHFLFENYIETFITRKIIKNFKKLQNWKSIVWINL